MIFEFGNYFQDASQEVWKPFILTFYPTSVPNYLQKHPNFVLLAKNIFSGKKIDIRILLNTFKMHLRRYDNRLF